MMERTAWRPGAAPNADGSRSQYHPWLRANKRKRSKERDRVVEAYLGDTVGAPRAQARSYRQNYQPAHWVITLNHKIIAAVGVMFWGFLLLALVVALLFAAKPVAAHGDAEWIAAGKYTNAAGQLCCGERDCGVFHDGKIATTPTGYRIDGVFRIYNSLLRTTTDVEVHELIPYSEATPSPDGQFWRCAWGGERKCFFAPPGQS